jgi:putative FmdB family regulatory protein
MPIYEYKCQDCGQISEFRITSQSQADALTCSKCGSRKLERKFSVPSISSGRSEPAGHSCCGNPGYGCSQPGSCCGH